MKLSRRGSAIALAALVLCLPLLSCCSHKRSPTESPVPTDTPVPVPVSVHAADRLDKTLRQAASVAPGQWFQLQITEEEITSYLVVKYPEAFFRDAQVRFEDDRMHVTALITNPLKVRTEIRCSVQIQDEQVIVRFEQVTLGSLNLPSALLESLASYANEVIDTAPLDVSITGIQLQEGKMIVSGFRKREGP